MGTIDRRLLVGVAAGAVAGVLLGLAIGWWWWPVEWTNAGPLDLAAGYQEDYVAMVADSYALTSDREAAQRRLEGWSKEELGKLMNALLVSRQSAGRTLEARRVQDLSAALNVPLAPAAGPTPAPTGEAGSTLLRVLTICGILLAVVLVLGGIALGVATLRRRGVLSAIGRREPTRVRPVAEAAPEASAPEQAQRVFVTTYTLGDDAYDESFSIETASGEFLGECGVSISEVIGTGDPDKVCAFEVWLFDRNDIRTVTKVLMSDYAFHDEAIRARQSTKGEAVLAMPGKEITLETASLQVTARVLELEYGVEDVPADSFFAKLTLQLTSSVKEAGAKEPAVL